METRRQPEAVRRREEARQRTLAAKKAEKDQEEPPEPPEPHLVKAELKAIADMQLWKALEAPLTVVLLRDHLSDGTIAPWAPATTRTDLAPEEVRDRRHERTQVEERHRQRKLFEKTRGLRRRRPPPE